MRNKYVPYTRKEASEINKYNGHCCALYAYYL
jgi:hypothetical protein